MKQIFIVVLVFILACGKKSPSLTPALDDNNLSAANAPQAAAAVNYTNMYGLYWLVSFPLHVESKNTEAQFQSYINYLNSTLVNDVNRNIKGITLYIDWNAMETSQNVYHTTNLNRLDRVIQVAKNNGRKYKLTLAAGQVTPAYIFDNLNVPYVTEYVTNPYNPDYGKGFKIPVPWNQTFFNNYKRVVQSVIGTYKNDPDLVAVSIGFACAYSPEWLLVHDGPNHDLENNEWLTRYPQRATLIRDKWKNAIDFFAAEFPGKQISIEASGFPYPNMFTETAAILDYGCTQLGKRFSVQTNQLYGKVDMINSPPYLRNVYNFRSRMHPGFQSVSSWTTPTLIERFGSMQMAVYNYIQANAQFWEVWEGDGRNPVTMQHLTDTIAFARQLGLNNYKAYLIANGYYKPPIN